MKLVAVSIVKNEADIIEVFVRHTRAWVDHHLVIDNGSTDGSRETLNALISEGLPLTLFRSPSNLDFSQVQTSNLVRRAFAEFAADWVLLLEADEFIAGTNRSALEQRLSFGPPDQPLTVQLQNYSVTIDDDSKEPNALVRIRYRQPATSGTLRVIIPRNLGLQPDVGTDKGNHALLRNHVPLESLCISEIRLCRFALRSPQQQALHIVVGEIQRLSRGVRNAGLDTHNRLGFQLLAADPEAFLANAISKPEELLLDPIPYLGDPLRYSPHATESARSLRAFLPFLEEMARSHGKLVDQLHELSAPANPLDTIQPLEPEEISSHHREESAPFSGFIALSGWQKEEGPVPSAFLPKFHWATAPETVLSIQVGTAQFSQVRAEVLTYVERQVTTVLLNGQELLRHVFTQVNQKEALTLTLELLAGENRLVFRHRSWLRSAGDPRKLALIFLSLRIRHL
jgi:hypothetical protein